MTISQQVKQIRLKKEKKLSKIENPLEDLLYLLVGTFQRESKMN